MSDEKGKGRAKGDEDRDKGPSDEQPSMLSRVASSARGLSRSTFANPISNELNERAAAAAADSGKGHFGPALSSGGSSTWAESARAPQTQDIGSSGTSFRAGHKEQHVLQSETEFSSFLDGIDSFSPSDNGVGDHMASGGLEDEKDEAWARSQSADHHTSPLNRTVHEQQIRDGEDVVAILTRKGATEETFEAPEEDENYDWGLSREQLSQLRAMTKDLFPPVEAHGSVDTNHPLNLAPNFEGEYGHAPQVWMEQWDGVLNRYTEEVWGGLLPLVKEAQKEVDGLRNDPSTTDQPKALRRLGAILGHLRQY